MQALARYGWMQNFDYLSTVSGGGYIGTCLTGLLAQRGEGGKHMFGVRPGNFPFGTRRPQAMQAPVGEDADDPATTRTMSDVLYWLRQHASYLVPGRGINLASLGAVVLGNAVVSLAFFFPILCAGIWIVLCAGIWIVRKLRQLLEHVPLLYGAGAPIAVAPALLNLAAWMAAVCGVFAVLYAIVGGCVRSEGSQAAARAHSSSYRGRRCYARWMGRMLVLIVSTVVVGTVHPVAEFLNQLPALLGAGRQAWVSGLGGLLVTLIGAIPALRAHTRAAKAERAAGGRSFGVFAAFLMIYGLLLLANDAVRHLDTGATVAGLAAAVWILLALSTVFAVGMCVDLNRVSMHRYYRDRLMEAFMPTLGGRCAVREGGRSSDAARLHEAQSPHFPNGPYHLINANAVLVDADESRFRGRGGDSFLMSPLYCGSDATGYHRTETFMGGSVTLASAMAISGAALNPNAGVGGTGVTRERAVSFLLRLFNARLGYWVRNPRDGAPRFKRPHYLWTGLFALLGIGFRETSHFIELSDGGHFENLALYELIRRRCRVIVVVDGGADPDYTFEDLANAVERVRVDFGASIDIKRSQLEQIVPRRSTGADAGCTDAPRPCMADTPSSGCAYLIRAAAGGRRSGRPPYLPEHHAG